MEFINSVLHIIIYFSLLLAPEEADRITISGLPDGESMEMTRDSQGWSFRHERVSISDGKVQAAGESMPMEIHVREAGKAAAGHDWLEKATLAVDGTTALEKTADGFILRRKEAEGTHDYRIRYGRSVASPPGDITVNVLGEVRQPGVYRIPASGSLADAIAAAGGWTDTANLKRTTVVRGPAGEVPAVTEHDVKAILGGNAASPPLLERDTVCVPEKLF